MNFEFETLAFDWDGDAPVCFSLKQAAVVSDKLKLQIPTECQWEVAAMCWSDNLFPWDQKEFFSDPEAFVGPNDFNCEAFRKISRNRLGLAGLGCWCE